ncbi:unnamed protein product [Linum trigynum]|uniref:Uncharacterized protein n=1 Tax=Linum trigynum TaxID=586398 RepID=A0AAV2ET35_9ROSI
MRDGGQASLGLGSFSEYPYGFDFLCSMRRTKIKGRMKAAAAGKAIRQGTRREREARGGELGVGGGELNLWGGEQVVG